MKHSVRKAFAIAWIALSALSRLAQADGMFIWKGDRDLREPGQKAVIHWDKGRETMVLQVKFSGPAQDFAWIVPLPSRPQVEALDSRHALFEELSRFTQWRARSNSGHRSKSAALAVGDGVQVAEQKTVGIYDLAVLSGSEAGALEAWLVGHGYKIPEQAKEILGEYISKEWWFCAMKISRKALAQGLASGLQEGDVQPLKISFDSETLVYPLRISSLNPGTSEILLYLLSPFPMAFESSQDRKAGWGLPEFCRPSPQWDPQFGTTKAVGKKDLPAVWDAFKLRPDARLSLSSQRAEMSGHQMKADLHYRPFDPLAYWSGRQRWGSRDEQLAAEGVLAWHNPLLLRRLKPEMAAWSLGPGVEEELAMELAASKDAMLRRSLAQNPYAPAKALSLLLDDPVAVYEVVQNPSLPLETLNSLVQGQNDSLRAAAVRNPNLPLEAHDALAKDKSQDVRAAIAEISSDPDLLGLLASDPDQQVRTKLARNLACPPGVILSLSQDPDTMVRFYVASRRSTPEKILSNLCRDADGGVRIAAAFNKSTPFCDRVAAGGANVYEKRDFASRPGAAADADCLKKDPDASVRMAYFFNRPRDSKLLFEMAADEHAGIRSAAAQSASATAALLEKLAKDGEAEVREAALRNPNLSFEARLGLGAAYDWERKKAAEDPATPEKILALLRQDADPDIRQRAYANESTPVEIQLEEASFSVEWHRVMAAKRGLGKRAYQILSRNPDSLVRVALTLNPDVPRPIVDSLKKTFTDWESFEAYQRSNQGVSP